MIRSESCSRTYIGKEIDRATRTEEDRERNKIQRDLSGAELCLMQWWEVRPGSTNAASPADKTDLWITQTFLGTGSHGPPSKPQLLAMVITFSATSSVPLSGPSLVQVLLLPGQRDAPVARDCCLQVILLLRVKKRNGEGTCLWKPDMPACYFSHLSLAVNFF